MYILKETGQNWKLTYSYRSTAAIDYCLKQFANLDIFVFVLSQLRIIVESLISMSTSVSHRATKAQTLTSKRVCHDQLPHEIPSRCIRNRFDAN